MQSTGEDAVRKKMEGVRLACEREIQIQQQRVDNSMASFRKSLELTKAKAHEIVQNQAKVIKLKAQLREEEDNLVKALAEKTRKEAKRMATVDSIATTRVRIEELRRSVEDHRDKKDGYAAIISQQMDALAACKEERDKDAEYRGQIEEAIRWYNNVLGFQIECGHGVKFIFTNINLKNPNEKYSFTIRHENDIYTMLDCDPHLDGIKELLNELNQNNGLFKFIRTMRKKFQEAAGCGNLPQATFLGQDSMMISVSAPVSSVSTGYSETPPKQKEPQPEETGRHSRKVDHGRGSKPAILSSVSASSLRRSPRFKVKK